MTKLEELAKCIEKLSADATSTLLDAVKILLAAENTIAVHDRSYYGSAKVIRYGHKCGKQRKGEAYAATVNCAKPDTAELTSLFSEHIAQGTLVLYNGLKRLPQHCRCRRVYSERLLRAHRGRKMLFQPEYC